MNNEVKKKLSHIVAKHGREIFRDAAKCEALLKDHCWNHKKEVNVLIMTLKTGIVLRLADIKKESDFNLIIEQIIINLIDETTMSEEAARWAVACWFESLAEVPDQIKEPNSKGSALDHLKMADELRKSGKDPRSAIKQYSRAIELDTCLAEAYAGRANTYVTFFKAFDEAIADYSYAIKLSPGNCEYYFNQGTIYYYKKIYDMAIMDFGRAIKLNPEHADAYNNRGLARYAKKDYELAIADYSQAIKILPENATAYNNRGSAYFKKGLIKEAIADYSRAVELKSDYAHAYNNRGNVYFNSSKYDRAVADYTRAIEIDPAYIDAYLSRSNIYFITGQYERAIVDLNKIIELNLNNHNAFYQRGMCYFQIRKYDPAKADLIKSIDILRLSTDLYIKRSLNYDDYITKLKNDSEFEEVISDMINDINGIECEEYLEKLK